MTNSILTKYTSIYLSIYRSIDLHVYLYLYYWNRSLPFFYSHVTEHVVWYRWFSFSLSLLSLVYTTSMFYVLSIIHQHTSTKLKLLMIKVCTWVAKTIERSQMKHIYMYMYKDNLPQDWVRFQKKMMMMMTNKTSRLIVTPKGVCWIKRQQIVWWRE